LQTQGRLLSHLFIHAQKSKLQKVIDCFPSFGIKGIGLTRWIEDNIDTSTAKPIKQMLNRLSPAKKKLLCVEIDRMIKMDVIEEEPSSP